jgi:hypothetical protein
VRHVGLKWVTRRFHYSTYVAYEKGGTLYLPY